jgi:hypothetical protein
MQVPLDSIAVYQWRAWKDFFISKLVDKSCCIPARYDDDVRTFERCLTPATRAVLFQINLSHSQFFPAHRQKIISALRKRKILVLNGEVEDIGKRHLHALLARAGLRSAKAAPSGAAGDLLFVKSDLNSGGQIELGMPASLRSTFLPRADCLIRRWDSYYVAKRGELDPAMWSNDSVVIERYIANDDGGFFRVYGFGDSIIVVQGRSRQLIKKLYGRKSETNIFLTRRQVLSQKTTLAADLQKQIKRFLICYPLAYFCLDIVHDGRQHFIVDLNLTPYADPGRQTPDCVAFLRRGAMRYLNRQARAGRAVA